mmetsp:Transcript_31750/g.46832  ORF Transcript_31750/g.46832 Transcript_31750/m.46832 type:complete len:272 (+) Transcript_31750:236-1051(+)|eukprot:CAMPEP_0194200356 /NCGR_PEP_ID=MMETSP0156-20130528/992_1 /TAXON_ID=33649 /ORGANISM="Thalassionema nitzschioides, Strain L26-B" /LENGTH=271 /DNA_ID=CAMNT_0038925337 /DNA_START=227 /DNA_END=1042 /DNA_ORIENTATION=-
MSSDNKQKEETTRFAELEAKAVEEATATADESFTPSPSLLNASSPEALLQQVDGPSLKGYEAKESVYVGKNVPVAVRSKLQFPIHVTAPGSIVEYKVESKGYDIGFSIIAEREEGITVVKESERIEAHVAAVKGKFLVGSVPCRLKFTFDNEYSWMREKQVSYRLSITPPSAEVLLAGRRRRAKACRKATEEDLKSARQRLESASSQKTNIESEIAKLEKLIIEQKKSLEVVAKEESWLKTRVDLRVKQQELLDRRLQNGWADEIGENGTT